jgi:hypothetical protein
MSVSSFFLTFSAPSNKTNPSKPEIIIVHHSFHHCSSYQQVVIHFLCLCWNPATNILPHSIFLNNDLNTSRNSHRTITGKNLTPLQNHKPNTSLFITTKTRLTNTSLFSIISHDLSS